jgi:hypothetical protein
MLLGLKIPKGVAKMARLKEFGGVPFTAEEMKRRRFTCINRKHVYLSYSEIWAMGPRDEGTRYECTEVDVYARGFDGLVAHTTICLLERASYITKVLNLDK